MNRYHQSVLTEETVKFLNVRRGCKYIDATVGGGGHARAILKKGGLVLGIDQDPDSIEYLSKEGLSNLKVVRDNFSHLYKIANDTGFKDACGILFDLGVSSHQLESPKRGFSFAKNGPLDMRMNPDTNVKASDLINNLDKRRLNEIFETYGQEKLCLPISAAICSAREIKPIEETSELAAIIQEVYRKRHFRQKLHPATKVFQALRIVVNSEILNLKEVLPQTVDVLKKGGRLVVISFHSLEDGEVKRFLKREKRLKVLTRKPIGPQKQEILENPKARSAKLRAAEKI